MSMEMDHSFTVPVPPEQAWDVLLDVEKIAPCMPGAIVEEFDGEVVTGRIKIKVGPVSLTYRGTAKFTERDPEAHVVVIEASGKETRGAGTASATVRASLEPESSGQATKVTIHTTMNVTGRPAQFGRGVMVEVGGKLVEQFAQNLAKQLGRDSEAGTGDTGGAGQSGGQADTGDGAAGSSATDSAHSGTTAGNGAAADSAAGSGTAIANGTHGTATAQASGTTASSAPAPAAPAADHINMIRLVAPALLKRVVPVAAVAAGIALLGRRFWRRMHKGAGA